jgi:hypothetical protein
MANYYVVGGEYADTAFLIPASGTELESYGPFNEADAKVRWRELTAKTVDNAMVRYFLKSEDDLIERKYWVIGGEYADVSFTRIQVGKELEVYGPFEEWEGALGFWRGLTSKSADDPQVRYDIRENYQPGNEIKHRVVDKLQQTATKSVSIAKAPEIVLGYLADARNFPKWASKTFKAVKPGKHDSWDADTIGGPARLKIKTDVELGVFDHVVTLGDGTVVSIPGRVLPIGGGAVVMLTFVRLPTFSDAQWSQDQRTVEEELASLKHAVESA